jgi:hypothetical protein
MEMPSTSAPRCLAAVASMTVDMPTRSAPAVRSILISAGVSKWGPGSPAYTPSASDGSSSLARVRSRAEYASVRSVNRDGTCGGSGPVSGERPVRLMWSLISTGSPTA